MSKKLWLKIIVVIIIQALLLTQVDFALAAMFQSKDTFREAALRFQRISTKSVSMIDGVACVQLSLSILHLPNLDLASIFSILQGSDYSNKEIISVKELRTFSNGIYKVLSNVFVDVNSEKLICSVYKKIIDIKQIIARSRTEKSTGPPTVNAKLKDFLLNRIV